MSTGKQANGKQWVSYSNCDKHLCTEGSECRVCRIEELEAENKRLREALEEIASIANAFPCLEEQPSSPEKHWKGENL